MKIKSPEFIAIESPNLEFILPEPVQFCIEDGIFNNSSFKTKSLSKYLASVLKPQAFIFPFSKIAAAQYN